MENVIHPSNSPEHTVSYQRFLKRNIKQVPWRTILPGRNLKSNSLNFLTDLSLYSMLIASQLFYKTVFIFAEDCDSAGTELTGTGRLSQVFRFSFPVPVVGPSSLAHFLP